MACFKGIQRTRLFTDDDASSSPIPSLCFSPCIDEGIEDFLTPSKGDLTPIFKRSTAAALFQDDDSGLGMDDHRCDSPFADFQQVAQDTPIAKFQIRRREKKTSQRFHPTDVHRSLFSMKRTASDIDACQSPAVKKQKDLDVSFEERFSASLVHDTCKTTSEQTIVSAVDRMSDDSDLLADGSRSYSLPTVPGKHQDLKSITSNTMAALLKGEYSSQIECFVVIDCRYPYEYDGGHIQGAINMYTKESINDFLNHWKHTIGNNGKRQVLIFHCEFSSERGPRMYRFLRSQDRELNTENYPHLCFPEVYLLEGGYKAFYETHQELCDPVSYKPMLHRAHASDLRHFRVKSKSWAAGERRRQRQLLC